MKNRARNKLLTSKFYWKELLKHLWENPQNMQAFNHITPSWRHFNFSPKRKEEPRQGMNIILTYSHTYDNDIHHPVKYVFPCKTLVCFGYCTLFSWPSSWNINQFEYFDVISKYSNIWEFSKILLNTANWT